MRVYVKHLVYFKGAYQTSSKSVALLLIIIFVIILIFSLPRSGSSWYKAVTQDADDSAGQNLTQARERKPHSFPVSCALQ